MILLQVIIGVLIAFISKYLLNIFVRDKKKIYFLKMEVERALDENEYRYWNKMLKETYVEAIPLYWVLKK